MLDNFLPYGVFCIFYVFKIRIYKNGPKDIGPKFNSSFNFSVGFAFIFPENSEIGDFLVFRVLERVSPYPTYPHLAKILPLQTDLRNLIGPI